MELKQLLRTVPQGYITPVVLFIGILVSAGAGLVSCEAERSENVQRIDRTPEQLIERDEYLVNTSGCHDCHSPKVLTKNGPEPDPARLLSGHPSDLPIPIVNKDAVKDWVLFNSHQTAIAGPWGVSFSANISSDETGIGNNVLVCCAPSETKEDNAGACCAQPEDGSSCCDK